MLQNCELQTAKRETKRNQTKRNALCATIYGQHSTAAKAKKKKIHSELFAAA